MKGRAQKQISYADYIHFLNASTHHNGPNKPAQKQKRESTTKFFRNLAMLTEQGDKEKIRQKIAEAYPEYHYRNSIKPNTRPKSVLDYIFHAHPVQLQKSEKEDQARHRLAIDLLKNGAAVTSRAYAMAIAEGDKAIINEFIPYIDQSRFLAELTNAMPEIIANAMNTRDHSEFPPLRIFYRFSNCELAITRILEQGVTPTNQHLSLALTHPEFPVAKKLILFGAPVLQTLQSLKFGFSPISQYELAKEFFNQLSVSTPMTTETTHLFLQQCRNVFHAYYEHKIKPFLDQIPSVPQYKGFFERWRKGSEIQQAQKEVECKRLYNHPLQYLCSTKPTTTIDLQEQVRETWSNFIFICNILLDIFNTIKRRETKLLFFQYFPDASTAHLHPGKIRIFQNAFIAFEKNELPLIQKNVAKANEAQAVKLTF